MAAHEYREGNLGEIYVKQQPVSSFLDWTQQGRHYPHVSLVDKSFVKSEAEVLR